MPVRLICSHDPWVFMDRVEQDPFQKEEKDLRERDAEIHLLEQSILKMGMNFSDYVFGLTEKGNHTLLIMARSGISRFLNLAFHTAENMECVPFP